MKKRILSILLCLFLLFTLTSCGSGDYESPIKAFNKQDTNIEPNDSIIASNAKYTLEYDDVTAGIIITDNATGTRWASSPTSILNSDEIEYNEMGMPVKDHISVKSILDITYSDRDIRGGGANASYSFEGAVERGNIVCKKIDNGMTVEYYYNSLEIMIPVTFVLKDDYVSISIDSKNIQENDKYKVTSIALAPFLCSAKNDTEDAYLFVPSGSGALVGVDTCGTQGLIYKTQVYGEDVIMEEKYDPASEKSARLPVYGYKSGDVGGVVVIDGGADSAYITSISGNASYRYSGVYATFETRGYTNHLTNAFNYEKILPIYTDNLLIENFSIRFYPLSGENANYTGMAETYRNYLIKECGLKENSNEKPLSLTFIGGTEITKSFLGIPYTTVQPTTTLEQTEKIIDEISNNVTKDFYVNLKGYGKTGVDYGEIAGGFGVNGNIGSVSQLKKLASKYKSSSVDMYMDFDLIQFNESGGGFSYFSDVSMHTGRLKADQYVFNKANRGVDEDFIYRLLKPSLFRDAATKLVKKTADWNLAGVSLQSMSSIAYSDYSDNSNIEYNSKKGFSTAVSDSLKIIKESNQKVMSHDANLYAALNSDVIANVPVSSSNGYAFIEDIPFYSMVFKGYIPMTAESINTAVSPEKTILAAVEGGIGLNYAVISNWDNTLIDANYPYFSSSLYSGVKEDISADYTALAGFYEQIKGAKIESNTVISSGVHCTVFDNGVTVYVNYNHDAVQTPVGEIAALDYLVGGAA